MSTSPALYPLALQIVWFKRDLRAVDHDPLAEAAAAGPVLPLYIVEPGLWQQPDAAGRHWAFIRESLVELRATLAAMGQPLVVRSGEAVAILEALRQQQTIAAFWSHEETGNAWTFARDRAVAGWARAHDITWHERRQFGVIRGLRDRTGWAREWDRLMRRPPLPTPARLPTLASIDPGSIPDKPDPGLSDDPCPGRQAGGRRAGLTMLHSFLETRGRPYRAAMATPIQGESACSRLSPHLAYGTLSLREIHSAAAAKKADLADLPEAERQDWAGALKAFEARLHWHCHFIQKLESEPTIETRNFHSAYDGLRTTDPRLLEAWAAGRTGWPFVDACMAMLTVTGWLNFRMRAMLMAVASYQLLMHWREPGLVLARRFVDYEPGIHWSQCQMQSGTTGINTVRIYNPIKQGREQDPEGRFIRRWCPELAAVPLPYLHTPWTMPESLQQALGCRLGRDYPWPVVDQAAAAERARDAVWGVRRSATFGPAAEAIQNRHGSRRSGVSQSSHRRPRRNGGHTRPHREQQRTADPAAQLDLDLCRHSPSGLPSDVKIA
jgi:deoxyribodipyrimidine photo-lyase